MNTRMNRKVLNAKAPSVSSVIHQAGACPTQAPFTTPNMLSPCQRGMSHPPRKSVAISIDTVSTCAYSAMKNIENFIELYSVWYPVTSSLSASGRSKGSRLVSAKQEIQKKKNDTESASPYHRCICCCFQTISVSETLPASNSTDISESPSAIS